jgi:hypothetical protein
MDVFLLKMEFNLVLKFLRMNILNNALRSGKKQYILI